MNLLNAVFTVDATANVSVSTGSHAESIEDRAEQDQSPREASRDKEDCKETSLTEAEDTTVGPEDNTQMEERRNTCSESGPLPTAKAESETASSSRHLAAISTRLTSSKTASSENPADLYWQFLDITTAQLGGLIRSACLPIMNYYLNNTFSRRHHTKTDFSIYVYGSTH